MDVATTTVALTAPSAPSATILTALEEASQNAPSTSSLLQDKYHEAANRHICGETMESIGQALGVQRQTVSQWISKAKSEAHDQLVDAPAILTITETLHRLETMRRRAWSQSLTASTEAARLLWQAETRKTEGMISKLQIKTGILPTDDPEKLYQRPSSNQPQDQRSGEPDAIMGEVDALERLVWQTRHGTTLNDKLREKLETAQIKEQREAWDERHPLTPDPKRPENGKQ